MRSLIELCEKLKIWDIIIFIQKYFCTEAAFLFAPNRSFQKFYSKKEITSFLNPELFLVINIMFAYLLYKTPEPFEIDILAPLLKIPFALLGVIFKYAFGFLIFLLILGQFLRKYKIKSLSLRIFHIICFASAIYIPSLWIKNLIMKLFFLEPFVNLITEPFSGINTTISFLNMFRIFIFPFICGLFFLCYWTMLFYSGLKNAVYVKPKKLFKITIISMLLFVCTQFMLFIVSFGISLAPVFKTYSNIAVIEKLITEKSPNYLKAALLAEAIADTEEIPLTYRYRAKIRAITYKLSTLLVEQEKVKNIIPKIHLFVKNYNYKEAEKLISDLLEKMTRETSNSYRPFYIGLLEELKKARDYRSLPNFSEELPEFVMYLYSYKLTPVLLFP